MAKVVKMLDLFLYPMPAVLVTCGTARQANIVTISCVSKVCAEPPMAAIAIRTSRHSDGLVKQVGEFVINLPVSEQAKWVDYCGMVSGRNVDKWAACGFTPTPGVKVQVPVIAECHVNIECRVQQVLSLGSHDLFIGEVMAIQVDEAVLDEKGLVDFDKAQPFGHFAWQYRQAGTLLGRFGFSKEQTQGPAPHAR